MAFEHKDGSGSLFENDRKERDSQPDWTGSAKIDGKDYWIAAWENEGRKGLYFSLKFTLKDEEPVRRPDRPAAPSGFAERRAAALRNHQNRAADMKSRAAGDTAKLDDDDIPF